MLQARKLSNTFDAIRKDVINTVQINLGDFCNQACLHCHVNASPNGKKSMNLETSELVLRKLLEMRPQIVEFTGGAPEMNPNLGWFIEKLTHNGIPVAVRTNLTILDDIEYAPLIEIFLKSKVKLIASLPSCFKAETDRQRGDGVFEKSIRVLKKLNSLGYGKSDLKLDIVHNPISETLPQTETIEKTYRKILNDTYGIQFNKLITITNSPIGRFEQHLKSTSSYDSYINLLVTNFNRNTLEHIMCRNIISIDYAGYVYDCDFNLALGNKIKDYEDKRFWEIDFSNFTPVINFDKHCYACCAGCGSSCQGILIKEGNFDPHQIVQKYYGEELKNSSDLKTNACCTLDSYPDHIKEVLTLISDEIKEKYYGCGSPVPLVLKGLKTLDIGCGTGRDCYIFSKLVGEDGFVYGIDMTESQIRIANKYIDEQMAIFGYKKRNVKFIHDYIENITNHIPTNSLDLIISNCVVNLIPNKEDILRKVYNLLKEGGEFYFSDIYSDRRIPDELKNHPTLYGECLGGALYYKDFERIARKVGFFDQRVVSKRMVEITNKEIEDIVGNITFYSITYRLWKIEGLEDGCEDYGHIAIYKGGIPESPHKFVLDNSHIFEKEKPERVCGNTALMLSKTRFKDYFKLIGSFEKHFGMFTGCSTIVAEDNTENTSKFSCC